MSDTTLAVMKEHLVVEHDDDDAQIQRLIDAAEASVVAHLRRDLATEYPGGWPEDIRQAVRFSVATWFESRSGAEMQTGLPSPAISMLAPHRSFA